ncbi:MULTISPECIES: alanine/glycine:cation symporter family protein [Clostridium]|uniref:Sodium:alanine symporter n=5 Tax=Clostridium TaxID=1485 RepID=A5I183_CLOBH|nr:MULTISPECIES: alanine/glycine:cation symporter family protein [Clostridium]EKN39963.1 sodium:alanine symporter family protein [Clostridium botulinum CFSAN001627]EKX80640.1 sodium:alanine symporter family protein [Clostridium botulinum CFSAN001628]EPS46144.1 sodium:alanine symporter family protein [Clostridium botulinum CFSAN002367]EPS47810.1 sodium:alanine symporter family protein [Clostridium botulinum CFSAN002369]ABS35034.1 sodium:alanine symporter family protein [Clostridium botulinum A 
MSFIENFISVLNNYLWSYILIALLIALGLFFSFKSKFVQIRYFKEMFRLLGEGASKSAREEHKKKKGVSSFQAFCISTASRVGTGNLAGVAIAIASGGPGAVFWMWLIALIGGASSFVESTLAQIYKVEDEHGFRGGPAYYMEKALNKKWMGIIFSILITISYGLVFNSVQANTISLAFEQAFGVNTLIIGLILAVLTSLIIFGGVQRIARATEIIVPIMAIAYVVVALFVILKNIGSIPTIFSLIIENAFGIKQVVGGSLGAAILMGIKRGLFSNEAGMGSAPNAAATANVTHPAKQGLIQTLGVFTDTILICSATSFIVLISGSYLKSDLTGIQLTQTALSSQVGSWGNTFIAICIFLFAFSSVIGNYYYGETNIEFLKGSKTSLFLYRLCVIGMVLFGCVAKIQIVWDMADLFMGFMAIINLIAISMLSKIAFAALKDYDRQKKQGIEPVFYADSIEGLSNIECWPTREEAEKSA